MCIKDSTNANASLTNTCANLTDVCLAGFAMTEALIVLAVLLQRVSLAEVGGSSPGLPPADPRITLRPASAPLQVTPV